MVRISRMQEKQYESWFWAISSRQVNSTAAWLFQKCCRCLNMWCQLPSSHYSRAVLVFTWNISKVYFGDVNLSVCFVQNIRCICCFLFSFLRKTSTLQRSKPCEARQDFSFESSYSFSPNVRRCTGSGNNI